MTDVVWQAVYVTRVTGQLEVDACYTGTQGNDAKCAAHEEEQACHILHEATVPTASQHPNDPAEEDDGHRHSHKSCSHPPQM